MLVYGEPPSQGLTCSKYSVNVGCYYHSDYPCYPSPSWLSRVCPLPSISTSTTLVQATNVPLRPTPLAAPSCSPAFGSRPLQFILYLATTQRGLFNS